MISIYLDCSTWSGSSGDSHSSELRGVVYWPGTLATCTPFTGRFKLGFPAKEGSSDGEPSLGTYKSYVGSKKYAAKKKHELKNNR